MNTVILLNRQIIKDGYHIFCAALYKDYRGYYFNSLVISEWKTNDKSSYNESVIPGISSDMVTVVETAYRWYDQWVKDNGYGAGRCPSSDGVSLVSVGGGDDK